MFSQAIENRTNVVLFWFSVARLIPLCSKLSKGATQNKNKTKQNKTPFSLRRLHLKTASYRLLLWLARMDQKRKQKWANLCKFKFHACQKNYG